MDGNTIISEARSFDRVLWRHQGRDPASGIDCAGFIILVGVNLKVLPQQYMFENYGRQPEGRAFQAEFEKECIRINSVTNRHNGDILIFKQGAYPCHCGFFIKENGIERLIHSSGDPRIKRVVEHNFDETWKKKMVAVYRFKGVN